MRSPTASAITTLSALSLTLALAADPATAASGSLDATYGTAGSASLLVQGNAITLPQALQPDGKRLVANQSYGYPALFRLLPDGSPDATFATGGKMPQVFGAVSGVPYAVLVQPDGKIVVSGYTGANSNRHFAVARFNPNGSRDTSFDGDGIARTVMGSEEIPGAAALQADGKILLAGYRVTASSQSEMVVVRYNANGSLDTSFSGDGIATAPLAGTSGSLASQVLVQPDGKIVLTGSSTAQGASGSVTSATVVRLLPDGTPDTLFGNGGVVLDSLLSAYRAVLQPDGRIVLAGSPNWDLEVVRLNPDGSLDTSFHGTGRFAGITTSINGSKNYMMLRSLLLQPDGRIVVGGFSALSYSRMVRLLPDGSVDSSFGVQGVAAVQGVKEFGNVILQPEGNLLMAAHYSDGTRGWMVTQRYLANDADNNGIAEPWDLTPAAFAFTGPPVGAGGTAVSQQVAIAGLGANVKVPVEVRDAEYALDGGTAYAAGVGFVGNGTRVNLRYGTAGSPRLVAGGMYAASNNAALILGERVTAPLTIVEPPPAVLLNVKNVVPQPEALKVPPQGMVMAVFDRPLVAASLNERTFTLSCDGQAIAVSVMLEGGGTVARLRPRTLLPAGTICTATLESDLLGTGGAVLPADYRWQFMVRGAPSR